MPITPCCAFLSLPFCRRSCLRSGPRPRRHRRRQARRRRPRRSLSRDEPGRVSTEETVIDEGPFRRAACFLPVERAPARWWCTRRIDFLYLVLSQQPRAALWHRRRARGLHLVRPCQGDTQGGMAGTGTAARDDPAPAYLPRFMAGGRQPDGRARALYLGSTVYRIPRHQPARDHRPCRVIGCFRLANGDVMTCMRRSMSGPRSSSAISAPL